MSRLGIKCLGVVAALAVVASAGGSASAQSIERRVATLAPPGSSWMKVLDKGAAAIEKATAGRIKTKYYSGGSQGDERDVIRKMRLGGIDGAALTSVGLSMIYSGIRVLELPRLFDNVQQMDCVRDKMWPYFQGKFLAQGYVLGEPGDVGFVYFLSKKPVTSMAELRDTKVWMWTDDKVVRAMFKKLGVNGVPLGVPNVLPSLQSGRIDACYGSPLAAVALQWAGNVGYMTSMPMSYAIGATIMRKDIWDKASATDIETQMTVSKNLGKVMRTTVRGDNTSAQNTMVRKGVKVTTTPAAMIAEFDRAAQAVWQDLAGDVYSREELKMVQQYRATCK